jgi:hypothetical protein
MITGLTLAATSGIEKYVDYISLLKILLVGLVGGAALVAVFSLGLVFLEAGHPAMRVDARTDGTTGTTTGTRNYPALIGAGLCFLIVVAAAAYGINVILSK